MTLDELIDKLQEAQREGFGDRRVIDSLGNDVKAVCPPIREGDIEFHMDDDGDAVMLRTGIDYRSGR